MKTNQSTNQIDLNVRLKAGVHSAYRELFNLHYSYYYNYALKISSNSKQAEDLVQEAFTKLWLYKNKITLNKPIHPYIIQIIKNTFITNYHKEAKQRDLIDQIKYETITAVNNEEEYKHNQLLKIESQIGKLSKKSKTIFNLNKKRGLCYKEISELLNISEKTVESHIYRALKRIKTELN